MSMGLQHTKQSSVYNCDSEGSIKRVMLSQQKGQVTNSSRSSKDMGYSSRHWLIVSEKSSAIARAVIFADIITLGVPAPG